MVDGYQHIRRRYDAGTSWLRFFYSQFDCFPLDDTSARSITNIQVQHVGRISFWVVHVPRLEQVRLE